MIRCIALAVLVGGVVLCARLSEASPLQGTLIFDARNGGQVVGKWSRTVKFKGGQRACVVVMGDHRPIVPITLEIVDEAGKQVAFDAPGKGIDASDAPGNDIAAVIWYPPRDGDYTIHIGSPGVEYNDCWIAIR
ncbi:MAG TPA: hypothetical protein VEL76_40490 [Gemmataceae bacterium]|nr:hypothetical protein [Gemmataceae bacterium]